MNPWIIALICIIPAWAIQNALHEASHLFFAWWCQGRKPLGFWPYPHLHDGRFYFARCRWGRQMHPGLEYPIYIAPFIMAAIWMFCTAILGLLLHPLFFAGTLTALVDALWFWRGYFWGTEFSDGKRYKKAVEQRRHLTIVKE